MILGYDFIGTSTINNVSPARKTFSKIKLLNQGVCDELHVYNTEVADSTLLALNTIESFDANTLILAHFDNSLGAGNYDGLDTPVYKYKIYKRKVGDAKYNLFAEVLQESGLTTIYDFSCKNNKDYEYFVVPVDTSGAVGTGTTASIKLNFWGWYVSDLSNMNLFKFDINLESSNIQNVLNITVQNTNNKYPTITQSKQNYLSGSLSTMPYDVSGNNYIFDINVLENIRNFLVDGKEKILRNTIGEGMKVRITDCNIKHLDALQSKEQGYPFTLNFSFIQTGEVL
jgi:hypothetical protein